MTNRRTNFKAMNLDKFIAYLKDNTIVFIKNDEVLEDGTTIIKVVPTHHRLKPRLFKTETGKQVVVVARNSNAKLSQFIKVVDDKIANMSTKGVYHPRRLKPKWYSLTSDQDKLGLFKKYMKDPTSSIGFIRLIDVNLPSKTLESIIIEHPQFESLIEIDNLLQKCIDKFKLYENGKTYLKLKGLN